MRRHCGRPGCNAVATATFSFDATRCVVWLNPIEDGMPRAGDLCTRHADGMAPPKGWERVDHRSQSDAVVLVETTRPSSSSGVTMGESAAKVVESVAKVAESVAQVGDSVAQVGDSVAQVGESVARMVESDDLLPMREPVKRKRNPVAKKRWHEVPNLFEEPTTAPEAEVAANPAPIVGGGVVVVQVPEATELADARGPSEEPNSWMPRYATDEDLGDVLDASTPLLSRAFNHARPSDDVGELDDQPEPGHSS
jgi:Protein of unknown function (DUF3499)